MNAVPNDPLLARRLALLTQAEHRPLLGRGLRGIERETLRVDREGRLAMTPHPAALGSALTHAEITTDYSESLLEFITPAAHDIADGLARLDAIHRYSFSRLGGEYLWSQSMPCRLPPEPEIPIAWYGRSHIGLLKHVYRRGLALRYGKTMQCIAGIHYNFSLAEDAWRLLRAAEGASESEQDYQSQRYITLLNNFHRTSWLLMVLFGASPAVSSAFVQGREHGLETLSADTLYLPHATSLRMSDLGYQNKAQQGLMPPYNTLQDYMRGLARAVQKPYPPYEEIGLRRDGEWVQINTHILQIENEYYSTARPKRVIRRGERPLEALCSRGVQYVEVRCMDVDPFAPVGIALETARFLDAYLHWCALADCPPATAPQTADNGYNFSHAVKEGRRPDLVLHRQGEEVTLKDWGLELLEAISRTAEALDAARGDDQHARALAAQEAKLRDPSLTPSARVLEAIRANGGSFQAFGMQQTLAHAADFASRPLVPEEERGFVALAEQSLAEQALMERTDSGDFDRFIEDYRARTPAQLCQEGCFEG